MKRNDLIEVTVEGTAFGGMAWGVYEGVRIKFKGGLVGQQVQVRLKRTRENHREGQLIAVLEPSPLETEGVCDHYGHCGGCTQQSLPYEIQLSQKEAQVKKLFAEANLPPVAWVPIQGSPAIFEYRNKMEFSFGDEEKGGALSLGMHKKGRHHDIVTVDRCRIMDQDYRLILTTMLNYFTERDIPYYHSMRHQGYLRHLVIRKAYYTGEILVNLVTSSQLKPNLAPLTELLKELPLSGQLTGFLHTINDRKADMVQSDQTFVLYGRDYILEQLLGLKFKISPLSFFQTNTLGAEALYSIVKRLAGTERRETIFDLYCGTGTIGQLLAGQAQQVYGIEMIEEAVEAAKENARLNGLTNCHFIAGDVKEKIKELTASPDLIVLDPPRAGIHAQALEDIISFGAKSIIYVSCNPKTLVNDLKALVAAGYELQSAQCMDLFAHTGHTECVVLMQKSLLGIAYFETNL